MQTLSRSKQKQVFKSEAYREGFLPAAEQPSHHSHQPQIPETYSIEGYSLPNHVTEPRIVNTHQLISKLLAHARTSPELGKAWPEAGSLSIHSSLLLISARLDSETRRAGDAEQRVALLLTRATTAENLLSAVRHDLERAREEVRLYKTQYESAQAEIHRTQRVVNDLERARDQAEAEAARARSTTQKVKEELLARLAREEGRREGYQEGLRRGRYPGYGDSRSTIREIVASDTDDFMDDPDVLRRSLKSSKVSRIRSHTVSGPSKSQPVLDRPIRREVRVLSPSPEESEILTPITPIAPPSGHRRAASAPLEAFNRPRAPDVAPFGSVLKIPTVTTPFVPSPDVTPTATAPPDSGAPFYHPQPRQASSSPNSLPTVSDSMSPPAPPPEDPRRTSKADGHFSPWEVVPQPSTPAVVWSTPTILPPAPRRSTTPAPAPRPQHPPSPSPPSQPLSEIDLVSPPAADRPNPFNNATLQDVLQSETGRTYTSVPDVSFVKISQQGQHPLADPGAHSSSTFTNHKRSASVTPSYRPPVEATTHSSTFRPYDVNPRKQNSRVVEVELPMPIPANAPLRPASAASTSRKISFPRRSSSRAAQRPEIQIVTPEFKEAPPRPTTTVPVMREAQYVNPLPESDSRSRGTFGWLLRKTNRSTKRSSTSTVPEIDVEPPSAPPSTASQTSPRSEIHLLSPDHAHKPLPFPDPNHVMDAIVASVRDSGITTTVNKPLPTPELEDPGNIYAIPPPRGIGGDQMPSGFAPTREGEDYFSSKLEHIFIAPSVTSIGSEPKPTKLKPKVKEVPTTHSPRYAEAPLPPGVSYPDSGSSVASSLTGSSAISLLESKPRLRVASRSIRSRDAYVAAGLPVYARG